MYVPNIPHPVLALETYPSEPYSQRGTSLLSATRLHIRAKYGSSGNVGRAPSGHGGEKEPLPRPFWASRAGAPRQAQSVDISEIWAQGYAVCRAVG